MDVSTLDLDILKNTKRMQTQLDDASIARTMYGIRILHSPITVLLCELLLVQLFCGETRRYWCTMNETILARK